MRRPRRAPRHLSRQPFGTPASCAAPYGARHRIAPLSRARPHATARCSLHARPVVRPARSPAPQRNGRRGYAPLRARPRRGVRCPCDASTACCARLRRGTSAPYGAVTNAGRSVRQRRPKAASECGALYHPVITPASVACLADPLPHKAWTLLLPPVTTLFPPLQIPAPAVSLGSDRRQREPSSIHSRPMRPHLYPFAPRSCALGVHPPIACHLVQRIVQLTNSPRAQASRTTLILAFAAAARHPRSTGTYVLPASFRNRRAPEIGANSSTYSVVAAEPRRSK